MPPSFPAVRLFTTLCPFLTVTSSATQGWIFHLATESTGNPNALFSHFLMLSTLADVSLRLVLQVWWSSVGLVALWELTRCTEEKVALTCCSPGPWSSWPHCWWVVQLLFGFYLCCCWCRHSILFAFLFSGTKSNHCPGCSLVLPAEIFLRTHLDLICQLSLLLSLSYEYMTFCLSIPLLLAF